VNAIVVDTSAWISYFKKLENEKISNALREGRVHLSPVVAAELLSAKLSSNDHRKMVDFLNNLSLHPCPLAHWIKVGEIRRELGKAGVHLSTPDAHIAQCALDLDAELISEDKIFNFVTKNFGLKLSTN
jgi:tRNA(fMet)-specific endonuclease VapC